MTSQYDVEKHYDAEKGGVHKDTYEHNEGYVPAESTGYKTGFLGKMQQKASKFMVEARGVEPVPPEERTDSSLWNVGSMWLSANMSVATFALGTLSYRVFVLGFWDSVLTVIFFNLIGALPVAVFATFGPRYGMRQMIMTRYAFGFYGTFLIALLNCLACVGWSAVNVVVGAQVLRAISHNCPYWLGILIITIVTCIVTIFGYKLVHYYEAVAFFPIFIIIVIIIAEIAKSGAFVNLPMQTGPTEAGGVLSFGAAIFGFAAGWTSFAADYTVYQPVSKSKVVIFFVTLTGLLFPLIFVEVTGVAAAMTLASTTQPQYADAFTANSVGGLIGELLRPTGGFRYLALVLLALSIVANNIPNNYSLSLSAMVMGKYMMKVPRFVWCIVGACVYFGIGVAAAENFEAALDAFLVLIGYWLAIYIAVMTGEHFIIRKGVYNVADWETAKRLPVGIAAIAALCIGVIGIAMGMNQPQYPCEFVGPLARKIGMFGGDIGFELAFAFTFVTYIPCRFIERKFFGR